MKKRSKKFTKNTGRTQKQKRMKLLRFLAKFNLFAVPLYLIILTGFTWQPFMQLTQVVSFTALRFIGVDASISNGFIVVPVTNGNFAATVSWDSTGWKSILALFALIFATEFPLKKKLKGLLLLPVIYAVNILRIVFMFFYDEVYI